ncbi:MAG: thiamine pyrophosphate-dependent dehydrogenase E1 component subunit alpha [Steroidobacteraceae bacterium]
MKPNAKQRIWMYEAMYRSRRLDDAVLIAYSEGKTPVFNMGKGPLPGEMHQSFGQEPCAVGVCAHLGADDAVGAGHRPHHVAVARGVNLNRMAAELFGKVTGLSGGRGGHMHLYDKDVNFFCSGIIAEGMGPGAGMALARKMTGKPGIAVAFVGDGAANQGAFHEVLNMVGLWKLPFICVIEDNKYGVSVSKKDSTAVARNSDRASAYALAGEYVAGNDPDLIFEAAGRAVERARRGEGGTILELETERLHGHFIGDSGAYRPEEERKAMIDPIPMYRARLLAAGVLSAGETTALEAKVQHEVDEAMAFGRSSAYPQPTEALEKLFA